MEEQGRRQGTFGDHPWSVQPCPLAFNVGMGSSTNDETGEFKHWVVYTFQTQMGEFTAFFDPDAARELARLLTVEAGHCEALREVPPGHIPDVPGASPVGPMGSGSGGAGPSTLPDGADREISADQG